MASTGRSTEDLGDSDGNQEISPQHSLLDKREQGIPAPNGSPRSQRSQRSDFSTQSATSSAASFDLAGRVTAFSCAHTIVGNLGQKNHGVGSPMHNRNRSSGTKKAALETNEHRDNRDGDKLNTALNDTPSLISKARDDQTSIADKDSVVSSASRISSLSQLILRLHNEKPSSADKDSVVSSASRISSLSQRIVLQASKDDRDSEDSVVSSASLIASLSQKILHAHNDESSNADKDSVVSSASLISSLSQRMLQKSGPSSVKSRTPFKSRSSQIRRPSIQKVEEITTDDKESVASSVSQVSAVSERIKALQKNSSFASAAGSPRASFTSSASPRPSHSSFGKGSTIDRNSMNRIQDRIRVLQKAGSSNVSSPRPPRPSFANRMGSLQANASSSASSAASPPTRSNPQEASRSQADEPLLDASSSIPSQPFPLSTETEEATPQNISEMTIDEDAAPELELSLQNVSKLATVEDPDLPPTIQRFPVDSSAPKATSHVSLPSPVAFAMDALREYSAPSSAKQSSAEPRTRPSSPDWLPQEHFAVADALFPENQFDVNDGAAAKDDEDLEVISDPPPRARFHSDGDIDPNFGFDDHGFPKFLASERGAEDDNKEIPHHIQFNDDDRGYQDDDEDRPRVMERHGSFLIAMQDMLKYSWKDKLPILMGCLLILIAIIVGVSLAASSSSDIETIVVRDDLFSAPLPQHCDYVRNGYSIPGEEQFSEVDLEWLLDVALYAPPTNSQQLTSEVQQLFQSKVLPTIVGCGSDDTLAGQYLVVNGYAWSVREIGNCQILTTPPCSRLLVSFVLWTKEWRDMQAMNDFCVGNFGFDRLVNPMESGDNIRQVDLIRTGL